MNGDGLSRGYSLVKNDDDTYTLYYNSLIDSSIYQGIDNSTDDYPEYKKFNVAYRHYTEIMEFLKMLNEPSRMKKHTQALMYRMQASMISLCEASTKILVRGSDKGQMRARQNMQ